MKLCSLFDGSGGFPLAGIMCGITPILASEIEPYPIAVTKTRLPNMKHLSDVSKINGAEIEPVDVITFGSPCQDLSVAGKRAGLKHEANGDEETTRSGLFMEAVRIIKEMREATNGKYPTFALWENVPGAFSSNKGEDFRIVCEELIKVVEPSAVMPEVPKNGWPYADCYIGDGWSLAYRVLDAQYWGVPQRRRRIYLVLNLRGERAGEVLFKRESLRGYFEKGRTPWQGTAGNAENSTGATDRERKCYGIVSKGNGEAWPIEEKHMSLSCGGGQAGQGFPCVMETWENCHGLDIYNGAVTGDVAASLTTATGQGASNTGPSVMVPYTLKIRSGVAVDSAGKAAGKGALASEDKAFTLAATQDQYLFQPTAKEPVTFEPGITRREGGHTYEGVAGTLRANAGDNQLAVAYPICMATQQGGAEIRTDNKAPTVTAAAGMSGNNQPVVCYPSVAVYESHPMDSRIKELDEVAPTVSVKWHKGAADTPLVCQAAGFCTEHSEKSRGIGYQEETAPTLRAGVTPALVYSIENHPADSRVSIDASGKVQTLTSRMGTGGGNVPMVLEERPVFCLQGNGIDRADTAGCNGKGWKEDICYTLNTIDRPAVAYAEPAPAIMTSASFYPQMKAESQCWRQDDVSNTLVNGTNPGFQNGVVVGYAMQGFGDYKESDVGSGLKARDYKDATDLVVEETPVVLDRAFFNQGQNAQYDPQYYTDGTVPTLVARGPSAVAHKTEVRYIVRRLTPTECARLQGFPDDWGHITPKETLTDEEYRFWHEVRNTHATINDKQIKQYTKDQMLTWYNKLHTDSAEYKMWGNGIALPTALYVMQGIADVLNDRQTLMQAEIDDTLPQAHDTTAEHEDEELTEPTDLSDAPEEIKAEIIENAEKLEKLSSVEEGKSRGEWLNVFRKSANSKKLTLVYRCSVCKITNESKADICPHCESAMED